MFFKPIFLKRMNVPSIFLSTLNTEKTGPSKLVYVLFLIIINKLFNISTPRSNLLAATFLTLIFCYD